MSDMRQLPLHIPLESIQRISAPLRRLYARYPVVLVAVYLALAGNLAFWAQLQDVINGSTLHRIGFLVSFFFLIVAFTVFLLQAFQFRYLTKPVLITILIASAFTSYFMLSYGVVIDTTMIHNVLETDTRESMDLVTIRMLVYVLLLGVIPALLVYKAPVRYLSPLRQLGKNAIVIVLSFGLIAGNFLLFSSEYTSFFRNHHHMRYLINPVNYIYSVGKVTAIALENHDTSPIPIGVDAKHMLASANPKKNSLIVVVVGETARARNFALNGYNRDTTPQLQHENVINYPNFYSCGTSTHVSLPCMFSMFGRDQYDEAMAQRYEKLPDILQRAGLNVLWLDNNSGCKGVCKNVPTEETSHRKLKGVCTEDGCFDDVMLVDLDKYIESQNKDTVIILHQNGSHGPAYYHRYPKQFDKFSPACNTNDLGTCTANEIVNAYDNTILYTDHFLEEVISLMKKESDRFDTAMLYVSDHGESLGEHNVYLHSLPYMIAPDEQKHVPFIAWFSDGFMQDNQFSQSCFKQRANLEYSHDYLFHSLLGLTHVSTSVYNPELDMFRPCHTQIARTPQQSPTS